MSSIQWQDAGKEGSQKRMVDSGKEMRINSSIAYSNGDGSPQHNQHNTALNDHRAAHKKLSEVETKASEMGGVRMRVEHVDISQNVIYCKTPQLLHTPRPAEVLADLVLSDDKGSIRTMDLEDHVLRLMARERKELHEILWVSHVVPTKDSILSEENVPPVIPHTIPLAAVPPHTAVPLVQTAEVSLGISGEREQIPEPQTGEMEQWVPNPKPRTSKPSQATSPTPMPRTSAAAHRSADVERDHELELARVKGDLQEVQAMVDTMYSQLMAAQNPQPVDNCMNVSTTQKLQELEHQFRSYFAKVQEQKAIIERQQSELDKSAELDPHSPMSTSPQRVLIGGHSSVTTSDDLEKIKVHMKQKDSIISQMDRAMAQYEQQTEKLRDSLNKRDMVLSQRQAELTARDEEIKHLKETMVIREKQSAWLKQELRKTGQPINLPKELAEPMMRNMPDRSTVARRIAMRSSPGHNPSHTTSLESSSISFSTPIPLDMKSSGQLNNSISPIVAGANPMGQDWASIRNEVQDQLQAMSKNRSSVYSPRASAVQFGLQSSKARNNVNRLVMKEAHRIREEADKEGTPIVTL